jgi:hypothetical protein
VPPNRTARSVRSEVAEAKEWKERYTKYYIANAFKVKKNYFLRGYGDRVVEARVGVLRRRRETELFGLKLLGPIPGGLPRSRHTGPPEADKLQPVSRKPDWIPCQARNDGPGGKTIPRCLRRGRSFRASAGRSRRRSRGIRSRGPRNSLGLCKGGAYQREISLSRDSPRKG